MPLEVGWQDTHFTRSPGESARPGTKLPGNSLEIAGFPNFLENSKKLPGKRPGNCRISQMCADFCLRWELFIRKCCSLNPLEI